ncbi:MAG: tetratricopeptide repeat protein, partial [Planctomycetota bacterium]
MRAILLPASLILLAVIVSAQDELLPPDEVQDLVERYVERGVESYREGGYDEARLRFKKALKRDKKNLGARMGIARCDMQLGAYENPDAIEPLLLAASIDLREGKTAEVRQAMRKLFEGEGSKLDLPRLRAGYLLAEAYAANGKRDDAKDVLNRIVSHYKRRYD